MPETYNPLLIAIRTHSPKMDCIRTYTTIYKNGNGYRVKFYGSNKLSPVRQRMLLRFLAKQGFVDIQTRVDIGSRTRSLVITARDGASRTM